MEGKCCLLWNFSSFPFFFLFLFFKGHICGLRGLAFVWELLFKGFAAAIAATTSITAITTANTKIVASIVTVAAATFLLLVLLLLLIVTVDTITIATYTKATTIIMISTTTTTSPTSTTTHTLNCLPSHHSLMRSSFFPASLAGGSAVPGLAGPTEGQREACYSV